MKIKKQYGTAVLQGNVIDNLNSDSYVNAPSIRAVNEGLNSLKEWKLHSSANSNNRIDLPDEFNELMIVVRGNDSNTIIASTIIPKVLLTHSNIDVNIGGRYTAGAGLGVNGNISLTSYNTTFVYVNGSDVTSTTSTYIYYR